MRIRKGSAAVAFVLLALGSAASLAQQTSDANRTPQGRGPAKARQAAAAAAAASAASTTGAPAPAQPSTAPAPAPPAGGTPVTGGSVVEDMKRQEEAAVTGKGLTYDPGDRRDPFISPAEAAKTEEVGQCEGEGVQCWLITEIGLVGIMQRRSGGVALVIGPEGYGATLRAGDKLYDGEVLSIDASTGTVVFRQKVNDPTRIKPYRDIEKKLNMTREGGV